MMKLTLLSCAAREPDPASCEPDLRAEAKARVFRMLVGYGIVSFAVLQVIEPIMHALHLPDAALTYTIVALALGFPVVIVLAWAFDINQGRIERAGSAASTALKGARLGLVLVGIGVLAAVPGTIWYFFVRGDAKTAATSSGADRPLPSIAVLPFVDMSPGKDQEYFSDGIAEEILNVLAQVEGLHVAGRTSSFSFRGKKEDLRSIGQSLGVSTVLEGSVRKSGDRVRITAQMIKVADGFHLWSQNYDRQLTDVFAVQDEIARSVVTAAKLKLLGDKAAVPAGRRAANPEAYAQFLLGRQLLNRGVSEDYQRSVEALEKAIALEPSYAPAHAGLSEALPWLVNSTLTTPQERIAGQQRAVAEAEKAIALAPDLAESNLARGVLRMTVLWDWSGARSDLERALALSPGDARVQLWLGHLLAVVGRLPEAVAATRKAAEADPLQALGWDFLGRHLAAQGELDESRKAFQHALAVAPDNMWARRELGFVDLLAGQPEVALASFQKQEGWIRLLGLALAHHDLGHAKEAREALDALRALADSPTYQVAQVFAWWGDRDRAFEQLERCRSTADAGVRYVKYDPLMRKLRGDPRYTALLEKMKLPLD
jgi:TolB-like protein/Flp pilus assembly protein TadD